MNMHEVANSCLIIIKGSASASIHPSVAVTTTPTSNIDRVIGSGGEATTPETSNHSRSSSKKSNHSIHSVHGMYHSLQQTNKMQKGLHLFCSLSDRCYCLCFIGPFLSDSHARSLYLYLS